MKTLSMIVLIGLGLVSCDSTEYAKVENFYYEYSNQNFPYKNEVDSLLQLQLDYILTPQSAAGEYPYYYSIIRGEKVPQVNIMLPHKTIHRLVPLNNKTDFNLGDRLISIDINMENDSMLVGHFTGSVFKENTWKKNVDPGLERYNLNVKEKGFVIDDISKHIIRISFK